MFLPMGWALTPTLVPSFVPSTSNMQQRPARDMQSRRYLSTQQRTVLQRRSSNSSDNLPGYTAIDENTPPAYRLEAAPGAPARPKQVHTYLPRDETRAGALTPPLSDDYVHMQNGLNFDVEANIAAGNTDQLAPRMHDDRHIAANNNNAGRRPRPTLLDAFANLFLLCAVIFWPVNIFSEFTGGLCGSTTSKAVFCGVPAAALFILWVAMFQEKGYWAISRRGKTQAQYRRLRMNRSCLMGVVVVIIAITLWQASYWICRDGCATGMGDGVDCIIDVSPRAY